MDKPRLHKKPKVIVVGAGLAGLTAAYRLQQQGIAVEVYEARERVGGRIFTATVAGEMAELGGYNITDGGEAENLHRLIRELDLSILQGREKHIFHYLSEGRPVSQNEIYRHNPIDPTTLREQLKNAAERARNMQEVLDILFVKGDLFHSSLAVRLAAYEGATADKLSTYYIETLYYMLLGGVSHSHQERMIDFCTIRGGNALLPERLAQRLEGHLHLNRALIAVAKRSEGGVLLTFAGGERVEADIVVLAIPCSLYKDISFTGDMIPPKRLEAIQQVQYGTNAKIIIPCQKSVSELKIVINDHLMGFALPERRLLTLYHTGESSRFSKDSLARDWPREQEMVTQGFGDLLPLSTLPELAKDQANRHYEGPVGYSWPNDPFAKGSYSYIAAGQEALLTTLEKDGDERVRALFAPIDQTLFFAGEHASILLDVAGTMEAACESGERTARQIITI